MFFPIWYCCIHVESTAGSERDEDAEVDVLSDEDAEVDVLSDEDAEVDVLSGEEG